MGVPQTSYMLLYGELPVQSELQVFEEAVARHSMLPEPVIASLEQLPHDSHPMAVLIAGITALSCHHPEQNPAFAGGSVYRSASPASPLLWQQQRGNSQNHCALAYLCPCCKIN
jgi:citrate synthase